MGGMPNLSQLAMMNPFAFNPQLVSQLMGSGMGMTPNFMSAQLSNKALGQMWMSQDKLVAAQQQQQGEEDEEEEDMGVAETYADYMPAKGKYTV